MVSAFDSDRPKCLTLPSWIKSFHRAGYVFDGHVGIRTVLVEEIDGLGAEPLERLSATADLLRPAVGALRGLYREHA